LTLIQDVEGYSVNSCILRPRPKSPESDDRYLHDASHESTSKRSSNKIKWYNHGHAAAMFNAEMRNHKDYKSECHGILIFDEENAKQWGISWREKLICTKCDFTSVYHNLYDVVESNK